MLADEYRQKRMPFWTKCWLRIHKTVRHRIFSSWWSISLNTCFLIAMALMHFSVPEKTRIALELTLSADGPPAEEEAIDPVEIATDEEEVLTEEEEEVEEPEEISEPEPEPEEEEVVEEEEATEEMEETYEVTDEVYEEGTELASRDSSTSDESSSHARNLDDLGSDQERIAETERRVAAAGGELAGILRASLSFSGDDDIDLYLTFAGTDRLPVSGFPSTGFFNQPRRSGRQRFELVRFEQTIWFSQPTSSYGGLDVDANAVRVVPHPCENIVLHSVPRQATYIVRIDHFRQRGRYEATPYVVVVKAGNRKDVFQGEILPGERMKTIHQFKFRRP